jgi:hypothetical protein
MAEFYRPHRAPAMFLSGFGVENEKNRLANGEIRVKGMGCELIINRW